MNLKRWVSASVRMAWLLAELSGGFASYHGLRLRRRGAFSNADKARWLQQVARRLVRVLGATIEVRGALPSGGLVVSNHLGYVDIIALAATLPCAFVSKREVRRWPIFGWFAAAGGTLFIDRSRRHDVARITDHLSGALDQGQLLVIFPEGTSSDGSSVLPFRSSLLEAASGSAHDLHGVGIRYTLPEGSVSHEVCWWGDMTLAGHLPRLLSRRGLRIHLGFASFDGPRIDRKQLARDLHSMVVQLRSTLPLP